MYLFTPNAYACFRDVSTIYSCLKPINNHYFHYYLCIYALLFLIFLVFLFFQQLNAISKIKCSRYFCKHFLKRSQLLINHQSTTSNPTKSCSKEPFALTKLSSCLIDGLQLVLWQLQFKGQAAHPASPSYEYVHTIESICVQLIQMPLRLCEPTRCSPSRSQMQLTASPIGDAILTLRQPERITSDYILKLWAYELSLHN